MPVRRYCLAGVLLAGAGLAAAGCAALPNPRGPAAGILPATAPAPARAAAASGQAERAATVAAGAYRFSGRCRLLAIGERDVSAACGNEVVLQAGADGGLTASFALLPSGGGSLAVRGRPIGSLGGQADVFWVQDVRFTGGAARLAGPDAVGAGFVGGCSYTDPDAERFTVFCLAVNEDGLGIEVRFEGDKRRS